MSTKELKMKKRGTFLLAICLIMTLLCTGFTIQPMQVQAATAIPGYVNTSSLNVRKSASTGGKLISTIKKKTSVTITKTKKNSAGQTWYKISFKKSGKKKSGYVLSSYITKGYLFPKRYGYMKKKTTIYGSRSTKSKKVIKVAAKTKVYVYSRKKVGKTYWYYLKLTYKKKTYKGYTKSSSVKLYKTTTGNSTSRIAKMKKAYGLYVTANTKDYKLKTLNKGTTINVVGTLSVNGTAWVKCSYGGTTGYVKASAISYVADATFAQEVATFPTSYRSYLIQLHTMYPNWHFKPVNTGQDWNKIIALENKLGKNTIQSNCPKGGSSKVNAYSVPFSYLSTENGAYNWGSDKYTLCDGSNFYTANKEVIQYYMDPRNFLNSYGIFQFEDLSYNGTQNETVVKKLLSSTFMKGSYNAYDLKTKKNAKGTYSSAFMAAARSSGASPYYLVTRVIQEVGSSGSGSTSGTYKGYKGYYNFFNIGAYDSSSGGAIANGLAWAKGSKNATSYGRPWTTPYKSIVDGSGYIAKGYIKVGQDTMYTQKFDVVNKNKNNLTNHQYMTAVFAGKSYGNLTYNNYKSNGFLTQPFTFRIPVYNNMPATPCKLPATKGNPNPFIKSLTVKYGSKNIALSSTFNKEKYSYTAAASKTGKTSVSLKVTAKSVSGYSLVTINGTKATSKSITVKKGVPTKVTIKCKSESGVTKTYKLTLALAS